MSLFPPEKLRSSESIEIRDKTESWLTSVRGKLQAAANAEAASTYIASLDLDTPSADRLFPEVPIDKGTERFLSAIEGMSWSEHMRSALAKLEDRRVEFEQKTGEDIAIEQFAALRTFLDHPGFYDS
jgi:hypothetical protein